VRPQAVKSSVRNDLISDMSLATYGVFAPRAKASPRGRTTWSIERIEQGRRREVFRLAALAKLLNTRSAKIWEDARGGLSADSDGARVPSESPVHRARSPTRPATPFPR
jgi:hypothetical protein